MLIIWESEQPVGTERTSSYCKETFITAEKSVIRQDPILFAPEEMYLHGEAFYGKYDWDSN
jgi:hypothetical protein